MKLPGLPIFLQFKRADRMVRKIAQEAEVFPSLPFFRMYLRRPIHSDQHQLLLDLEAERNLVLYAAPGFSKSMELHDAYACDQGKRSFIPVLPMMR